MSFQSVAGRQISFLQCVFFGFGEFLGLGLCGFGFGKVFVLLEFLPSVLGTYWQTVNMDPRRSDSVQDLTAFF